MQIGELVSAAIDLLGGLLGGGGTTPAVVVQVKARVPGTRGVRKASDTRPEDILKASTSTVRKLSANAPVILVRGCNKVELEADTSPPDQPVTWSVESNENTDPPCAIVPTDGGKKATLSTNVHGSFSVIARSGSSFVVWNVVFVGVKVLVDTTVVTVQNKRYADAGSNASFTAFRSGEFIPGRFAWSARVDLRVVGGGNSKRLGSDKVKVHLLQNGIADTLTGNYAPAGTALEVPKGGLPILDSNDASTPFLHLPISVKVTPNQANVNRRIFTGDSPTGSFPGSHPNIPAKLGSISGVNGFAAAVAGVSDEAPNSIVVVARVDWTADYAGTVDATGVYARNGAKTTSDRKYRFISKATGGQDAFDAGMETFEPRFNNTTDTKFTP